MIYIDGLAAGKLQRSVFFILQIISLMYEGLR